MAFKPLYQRIKRSYSANIFIQCLLLSTEVWLSHANLKNHRFVRRQINTEAAVNYEQTAVGNPYHQPHFIGNRTAVVQLFEWKFTDIAAECRDFLGPQGYAGVQLSPVLEHTVVMTSELNHPWWERYEVVSYRLASRSGDESEFWSMSRICNEHGVRIFADVILNHMAAPLHVIGINDTENEAFLVNTLLETNVNISQQSYTNVSYTQEDFHRPFCQVLANAQDAHEIRNCQLNGHPDLDHARGNVQKHIVDMLNKFVDMGVAGFRIDTARYLWPIDLKNIFKEVKNLNTEFNFNTNSRPFVYLDVFDLGLDTVSKTEYTTYGVVSEYLYPTELSTILSGKVPLTSLINWGPALGFLPHEDSLVFIDSHDTQRGLPLGLGHNRLLTYKNRLKYIMANVFMLVHPYGAIKRIMSSYYFPETNIDQGPPVEGETDEEEHIQSPQFNDYSQCTKQSGWVCEHRWPELVNMLKVANYFKEPGNKEESIIHFQTNGPNQVAFCRGHKAFVAINNDDEMDFVKEIYACLEPGQYCDIVTGGKKQGKEECHGNMLEINEKGYIKLEMTVADKSEMLDYELQDNAEEEEESGKIKSYGILVIYVESKINPSGQRGKEGSAEDEEPVVASASDNAMDANTIQNSNDDANLSAQADNDENEASSVVEKHSDNPQDKEVENLQENVEDDEDQNLSNEKVLNEIEKKEEPAPGSGEKAEEQKNGESGENQDQNEQVAMENIQTNDKAILEEENGEHKNSEENLEGTVAQNSKDESAEEADEQKNAKSDEDQEQSGQVAVRNIQNNDKAILKEENEVQENSTENHEENVAQTSKDDVETAKEAVEDNQSKNVDETIIGSEEQIEKPSAEVIDEINTAVAAVTAKIQDIQTAGFASNPKGGGNNG